MKRDGLPRVLSALLGEGYVVHHTHTLMLRARHDSVGVTSKMRTSCCIAAPPPPPPFKGGEFVRTMTDKEIIIIIASKPCSCL